MDCKVNISDIADSLLQEHLDKYRNNKKVQEVNFRDLASWVSYGERASHMIHLYPAKLLPHIPAFFLANNILSKEGDVVLDPFSGSGTTLLEALLAKKKAVGADSNPLARLISEVKTTPISKKRLTNAFTKLKKAIETSSVEVYKIPDVVNIDHWFYPHVQKKLAKIYYFINEIKNKEIKNFFKIAFSNTIKKVSLADPRLSVPVRLNVKKHKENSKYFLQTKKRISQLKRIDVYSVFYKISEMNIARVSRLYELLDNKTERIKLYDDARLLSSKNKSLWSNTVQLVITSPPYGGAQKYIRSSCLNMGWLEQCKSNELRKFEKKNIGREHYSKHEYVNLKKTGVNTADDLLSEIYDANPLRAHIASNYLTEMNDAFNEITRVLKVGGYIVLVIGDNQVCGYEFETKEYLKIILLDKGLSLELELIDNIHSRGLMTKRNKTAGIIASESVLIFKKTKND